MQSIMNEKGLFICIHNGNRIEAHPPRHSYYENAVPSLVDIGGSAEPVQSADQVVFIDRLGNISLLKDRDATGLKIKQKEPKKRNFIAVMRTITAILLMNDALKDGASEKKLEAVRQKAGYTAPEVMHEIWDEGGLVLDSILPSPDMPNAPEWVKLVRDIYAGRVDVDDITICGKGPTAL